MSEMRIIETGAPEESSDLALAMDVWTQLNKAYPDHPWQVSFQGGALVVRHAVINAYAADTLKRDGFGFLLPKDKLGTHKEVVTSAIQAGGMMLERFGMKRGKWDGADPVPPKEWLPKQESNFS